MENVRKWMLIQFQAWAMTSLNLSLDFACLRNTLRVLIYLATTNSKSSLDIQKKPAKIKTGWRNQDSQIRSWAFCYLVKQSTFSIIQYIKVTQVIVKTAFENYF